MRKISVVTGIIVLGLILAMQLNAQNLHKESRPTPQKVTDWNDTSVFLPEAHGFLTTIRGHGKACYIYVKLMGDNITPIGSPALLWCESDPKAAESRSPNQ